MADGGKSVDKEGGGMVKYMHEAEVNPSLRGCKGGAGQ